MSASVTIGQGNRNQVDIKSGSTKVETASSPSLAGIVPLSLIAQGNVLTGRLVANVNGRAVPYDVHNLAHTYALIGIAITSALSDTLVLVQSSGRVTIPGWGLTPGSQYRAGSNGQLITGAEEPGALFSQIIGRAISTDSMQLNFQSIIIH